MTQPDRRHLRRARLALAVVVAAALAAWLWFPGGRTFLQQSLTALASLDPQQVRGFIAAWGPQAALVSFALMILQAIVAPLPAFLITLANAALFGAFWGGALSWFSAMVGAGLCFCIARRWGAKWWKLTGRAVLRGTDGYFTRFGPQTICLPPAAVVPFDPVSYAADLTSLRFWPFMLATGVGRPGDYRLFLGRVCSPGHLSGWPPGLSLLFAPAVVISIAKNIYRERRRRRHELTPAGFCPPDPSSAGVAAPPALRPQGAEPHSLVGSDPVAVLPGFAVRGLY
ncbi:TVP38/TMEM64 family protein [Klebsiella pneumoniae]|uniref:TVP38/TMEM64 family protein n=1 Tax=Klebsiella pneumoniae TaxID=573 RepID=UPI003B3B6CE9